jgi:UDP-N-acetylmuramate dehydrogenase
MNSLIHLCENLRFKSRIRFNEPLYKRTTFKIGGFARFWAEPKDIDDLRSLLDFSKKKSLPLFVIGKGSNLLVKDGGFRGIVICLNSPYFKRIKFQDNAIFACSGVALNNLINFTKAKTLSGCEFLWGIPGTVGGALVMNAGTKYKNIGDLVEEVTVMDYNGKVKTLNKKQKQVTFGYRTSNLSKYIILGAKLKLKKGERQDILKNIKNFMEYRRLTQELSRPSAGCIFKNPTTRSAGKLIELCGLKGTRVGDACVSGKHANFIVNLGSAQAKDVLKLIDLVQMKVKEKFEISLEPEIEIVGE